MPSRWQLTLTGPVGAPVPLEAPHAVVSRWLDVDHKARVKPYALSPPRPAGTGTVLEVRLLDDALGARLRQQAPAGTPVRLGRQVYAVAGDPAAVEAVGWPELAGQRGIGAWRVEFHSPVSFRHGDRSSPLPAPDSVVRSLAERWRALHPATAPGLPAAGLQSLWVSDLAGSSQPVRLAGRIVSGFVGRVRYVCDDPEEAVAADALLRFASYAGVGSHTAFGFGVTRVGR